VRINARGQDVSIDGDAPDVATAERILEDFSELFREGRAFTDKELREAFAQIAEDRAFSLRDYFTKSRFNPSGKKQVAPKSANQRKYIQAIQEQDVVFGIGVAGTGKTYLAVALAVQALMQSRSTASCSRGPRWKRARNWVSFRATCRRRWILIFVRFTTHCLI